MFSRATGPFVLSSLASYAVVQIGLVFVVCSVALADSFDDAAYKEMATLNARLPLMIDRDTRADGVLYFNRIVTYHFTFIEKRGKGLTEAQRKAIASQLQKDMVAKACSLPDSRGILNKGRAIRYVYSGSDKVYIAEANVLLRDCK